MNAVTAIRSVEDELELTILMPCLNEAETISRLASQRRVPFLRPHRCIAGEVVIADNGSTDGSQAIAKTLRRPRRSDPGPWLWHALLGGVQPRAAVSVIMGDADDSYDFGGLDPFLDKLREGATW